jgi:hypothetical protein
MTTGQQSGPLSERVKARLMADAHKSAFDEANASINSTLASFKTDFAVSVRNALGTTQADMDKALKGHVRAARRRLILIYLDLRKMRNLSAKGPWHLSIAAITLIAGTIAMNIAAATFWVHQLFRARETALAEMGVTLTEMPSGTILMWAPERWDLTTCNPQETVRCLFKPKGR